MIATKLHLDSGNTFHGARGRALILSYWLRFDFIYGHLDGKVAARFCVDTHLRRRRRETRDRKVH